LKGVSDGVLAAFAIAQHVVIPKPQDLEALLFEPSRSCRVPLQCRGLIVLSSVDLDRQLSTKPDKISDVRTNRRLTAKQDPIITEWPEEAPHARLGHRLIAAQAFRSPTCMRIDVRVRHDPHDSMVFVEAAPSLTLPHKGGGDLLSSLARHTQPAALIA